MYKVMILLRVFWGLLRSWNMLDTSKRGFLYGTEKKTVCPHNESQMVPKQHWRKKTFFEISYLCSTEGRHTGLKLRGSKCLQDFKETGCFLQQIKWYIITVPWSWHYTTHTHTDWMNGLCQRLALGSALLSCAKTVYVILGEKKEAEHVPCQTFILSQACTQHIPGATAWSCP